MFCSIGQEEWLKNLSIEFSFPELRTEEHLSTLRELTVRQVRITRFSAPSTPDFRPMNYLNISVHTHPSGS